jgi:hypothetical protein
VRIWWDLEGRHGMIRAEFEKDVSGSQYGFGWVTRRPGRKTKGPGQQKGSSAAP